jgi:hypothetical protein
MNDVLFNQSETLQTDLRHVYETFKESHELFLTPNAKLFADNNAEERKLTTLHISLIVLGGIILAPALAIGCYTIMQRCSRSNALKSMAFLAAMPKANAAPITAFTAVTNTVLTTAIFHFVLLASITLLIYAIRYFVTHFRFTRHFLPHFRPI